MKQKQSSSTAEGMALVRAIEASRPANERICYDPIARSLVNPISVFLSKLVIDSGIYGIDEGRIEPFLTKRGFRDVRNEDAEELKRLYFTGPNAGRVISTGAAIASAKVNKSDH